MFKRIEWNNHRPYNYLKRKFLALLLFGCLFPSFTFAADATAPPLKITLSGDGNFTASTPYSYYIKMLRLALEKTRATDGDYVLDFNQHGGGIERDRAMLIAGTGIDVMWASVTRERAEKLRVIDVDLLKGLNNYRALLIHKSKKNYFDQIGALEDLKKLKTGTGPYWTDGVIMKDNGFMLVYGASYSGLFKMLSLHRFDFFSRGLHEVYNDLVAFGELGLVRAPSILLQYDRPVNYCFFVNKKNKKLADRIERGLLIAQKDGSFDELFFSMEGFRYGQEVLDNQAAHLFIISNTTNF